MAEASARASGRRPWLLPAAALMLLAAGVPTAQTAGLRAAGLTSVAGMAPQTTAPPPFGAYHDLRWVFVLHDSWAAFGAELAASVVFRTVLNTALVVLAWPPGAPRPAARRLLAANAACTVLVIVIFSPWATLTAMTAATSLSWFLFGALLPVLLLAAVMNRGGIVPGWWRHPPTPATVGIALLTFALLSAGSTAISAAPGWWQVGVAFLAGLVNAGLWAWLVRTVSLTPLPGIPAFVTPLAIMLIPALLLGIGGHLEGLSQAPPAPVPDRRVDRLPPADRRQVIYIHGYGSTYAGEPVTGYPSQLAFSTYSYRGQYPDGAPLPYGADATHQSLRVLADRLGQQVDTAYRRSGRPVALVTDSEGTLVARTYLAREPRAPVDTLLLLSPLVRPARLYYPPEDATRGWGIGTGWEIRMLTALSRLRTGSTVSADEPFVRSVLERAPFYRNTMLCPIPHVRVLAFLPTASAASVPPGHLSDVPTAEIEGLHGSLASRGATRAKISAALTGRPVHLGTLTSYRLIQDAAAGWQMPPLPLTFIAGPRAAGLPDAALGSDDGCGTRP